MHATNAVTGGATRASESTSKPAIVSFAAKTSGSVASASQSLIHCVVNFIHTPPNGFEKTC